MYDYLKNGSTSLSDKPTYVLRWLIGSNANKAIIVMHVRFCI